MGCGASVKQVTDEQKDAMSIDACKRMMSVCANHVVRNTPKDVTVPAPADQVKSIKDNEAALRNASLTVKGDMQDGAKAGADAAKGMAAGLGGAVGGMLSKAADVAGQAANAVAGAGGDVAAKVFSDAADGLKNALEKVDAEFGKVGDIVVVKNADKIMEVYQKVIDECIFNKAFELCRGEAPFGQAEYDACASDRVTKCFNGASASLLEAPLLAAVQDNLSSSSLVESWDSTIGKFNAANAELGKNELTKQFQTTPIELDIKKYIVQQIIISLGELMGKQEAAHRKNPAAVASDDETFCIIFSGATVMPTHYSAFCAKQQAAQPAAS